MPYHRRHRRHREDYTSTFEKVVIFLYGTYRVIKSIKQHYENKKLEDKRKKEENNVQVYEGLPANRFYGVRNENGDGFIGAQSTYYGNTVTIPPQQYPEFENQNHYQQPHPQHLYYQQPQTKKSFLLNNKKQKSKVNGPEEEYIINSINDDFLCPISFELMYNPVILACGHSFEENNLKDWLAKGKLTCPCCNKEMKDRSYARNFTLKNIIEREIDKLRAEYAKTLDKQASS